jgi:hypothetical protein
MHSKNNFPENGHIVSAAEKPRQEAGSKLIPPLAQLFYSMNIQDSRMPSSDKSFGIIIRLVDIVQYPTQTKSKGGCY